jgi:hypothetical protein
MVVKLKAYANCDDVHLVWTSETSIDDCLGFAIECRRKDPQTGKIKPAATLSNRVGFAKDKPTSGEQRSSRTWPFQRYDWTDHAADLGDTIEYRVIAQIAKDGGLVDGLASGWTGLITLGTDTGNGVSAMFNRGFVISQFIARHLKAKNLTAAQLKARIAKLEEPIRKFLSGTLRTELLGFLDGVRRDKKLKAYAALYELEDEELEDAIIDCGKQIEVVLANGSVKKKGDDQNAAARNRLRKAKIVVHDRMVSPGALGHNKFVVICA